MAPDTRLGRAIGMNHVALEVGDIDEALDFYGQIFDVRLRGRGDKMAFIDLGDQFIALSEGRRQAPDDERHLGLVVLDKDVVRERLEATGADLLPGSGVEFRDPWGNRIQIVGYSGIQYTKAPNVLAGMGLAGVPGIEKTADAKRQLDEKGMGME